MSLMRQIVLLLASVLLLAALVGSIIIAWPRSGEEDTQ